MKSIKMLMIAALTILSVSVFAQTDQNQKSHKATPETTTFSCPIHPEITSNKGVKCSKCGMDLNPHKIRSPKRHILLSDAS